MSHPIQHAILVVGHGSRREEANLDVISAAERIRERGGYDLVEAAFLEITHPTIAQGFESLVAQGAHHITVHPYFLSPGRHTRGDLPHEVAAAAKNHPDVTCTISEPLSGHWSVIDASIDRINAAEGWSTPSFPAYRAPLGTVFLVGAGPGDPGLLTIKARDLLAECDVIVYDYLVNPELLRYARKNVESIPVWKVGGGRQTPQSEINQILIDQARQGKRVVRLKGGDPFVFGRGGEEALALQAAGIPFEIVPGISSALAAPAYAGIPLTHRGLSSSFAVVSGARAGDGAISETLVAETAGADTVVVLMGMAQLRSIVAEFIAAGRPATTPVAVIRWGTYDGQQKVIGTLETIAEAAERAQMKQPAVIVIGEVVSLHAQLDWFPVNQPAQFAFLAETQGAVSLVSPTENT